MAMNFNEAAEFVRRWAEKQRDIVALGDALKEIGAIDHARAEQQAELDKVVAQKESLAAEIAADQASHAAFMAGRDKDLAAHRAEAGAIMAAANAEATRISARSAAAAQQSAAASLGEASRARDVHVAAMHAAELELAAKQSQLDAATSDLETVRAEHLAVVEQIQAMRDAARNALQRPPAEAPVVATGGPAAVLPA